MVSAVTHMGFKSLTLAARFRTAASSGTLVSGLAQNRAAREYDRASIYAHTLESEKSFWKRQWRLAVDFM